MSGVKHGATKAPLFRVEELEHRLTPTINVGNDFYTATAGRVLTVPVARGVLANDFSTTNSASILQVSQSSKVQYLGTNAPPLTATNSQLTPLLLNSNGSFQLSVPSDYRPEYGDIQFKYNVIDYNEQVAGSFSGTVTIKISSGAGGYYAVGSGVGSPPRVRVFQSDTGLEVPAFAGLVPYEDTLRTGIRVATGDLNGDGIDDLVVVPAVGGGPRVKVYDGASGVLLEDFFAFGTDGPNLRGGGYVAIGNVNGTETAGASIGIKRNDLIVGAGEGGGPRVQVFNGTAISNGNGNASGFSTTLLADFFAYDLNARVGVRVAAGDLDTANTLEQRDYIITSPGIGGGPQVKIFDYRSVSPQAIGGVFNPPVSATPPALRSFFAFDPNDRGGVYVAVGQFRGDGKGDIVVSTGSGTGVVRVFDGRTNSQLRELTVPTTASPSGTVAGTTITSSSGASNFSGSTTGSSGLVTSSGNRRYTETGGVRVSVSDRNADGRSDIVVGLGPGGSPRVKIYDGSSFLELDNQLAFDTSFVGGVFVGGNSLR